VKLIALKFFVLTLLVLFLSTASDLRTTEANSQTTYLAILFDRSIGLDKNLTEIREFQLVRSIDRIQIFTEDFNE